MFTHAHRRNVVARAPAKGFSLIELMIAVAIVGVLAAIGVPSYKAHVVNAKVPDAFLGLSDLASKAQQFYLNNKNYDGFTCATSAPATNYTFTCAQGVGTGMAVQSITFTATGRGSLNGYVYTLDSAGTKTTAQTVSGGASSSTCWLRTTGGAC